MRAEESIDAPMRGEFIASGGVDENEIEKQVVESTISALKEQIKDDVLCQTLVDAAHLSITKNNFEKAFLGTVDARKSEDEARRARD